MFRQLFNLFSTSQPKSLPEELADWYRHNPDLVSDAVYSLKGARSTLKDTLIKRIQEEIMVNGEIDRRKADELIDKAHKILDARNNETKIECKPKRF